MKLQYLKDYLPIMTAFLGAFLAYVFSGRKYKLECFYKDANESLTVFCSPVFHELRKIKLEKESKSRELLLKDFIEKYNSKDTILYKSCNQNLIDTFYDLDDLFIEFRINRTEDNWTNLWMKFIELYNMVKKEYWDIQSSLYKEYPWQKYLTKKNYLVRFLMEIMVFTYDTVQFFTGVWLLIVYIIIYDRITGKNSTPSFIISNFKDITYMLIMLLFFCLSFSSPYIIAKSDYKRKKKFVKKANEFLEKRIFWLLNRKTKGKFNNAPSMYIRKDVNDI